MTPAPRKSVIARPEGYPLPITVIIPAYNRADTVARAVASALAQRPSRPAEVVVVDDGSADDTAEAARLAGARVVRHSVNRRLGAARNTGLSNATQPWIALLDSDDEWLPHHLASLWPLRGTHVLIAASALRCAPDGQQLHLGRPSLRAGRCGRPRTSPRARSSSSSAVLARRDAGRVRRRIPRIPWRAARRARTSIYGFVCSSTARVTFRRESACSTTSTPPRCPPKAIVCSWPGAWSSSPTPSVRGFGLSSSTSGTVSWDGTPLDWRGGPATAGARCVIWAASRAIRNNCERSCVSSASDTQLAAGLRKSRDPARIRSPWWTRQRRPPRPPPASVWSCHPVGRSSRATPRSPAVLRPRSWWMGGPNACSSGSWGCGQSAELRGRGGGRGG